MGAQTVLVVDDQPIVVDVAEEVLKGRGYIVLRAHSGEEALTKLDEIIPDIVLCDILLGNGLNGYEVIQKSRENGYKGPFVLMSGFDKRDEALANGARGYVRKPFDSKMLQVIDETLAGEAEAL